MPERTPADDIAWFNRTAHCGKCGHPGDYCLCGDRNPCGCRELHTMGSGRTPDALDAFADTPATTQEEALW